MKELDKKVKEGKKRIRQYLVLTRQFTRGVIRSFKKRQGESEAYFEDIIRRIKAKRKWR